MRALWVALSLSFLLPAAVVHAQCHDDGTPKRFEERYGDALGGAAAVGLAGAAAGALLGLVVPAVFCDAGIGRDGCEAAWALGVGGGGALGWGLGIPLGIALATNASDDSPFAGEGYGLLAGALLLAGGLELADETHDDAFAVAGIVTWVLAQLFVAPLVALAFERAPRCGTPRTSAPHASSLGMAVSF